MKDGLRRTIYICLENIQVLGGKKALNKELSATFMQTLGLIFLARINDIID